MTVLWILMTQWPRDFGIPACHTGTFFIGTNCMFVSETKIKLESSVKDEDELSEGDVSVGREHDQQEDIQTNDSQSKASLVEKLKSVLKTFSVYGKLVLDKVIGFLNALSKDYRAVARHLKKVRRDKRRRDSIRNYRQHETTGSDSIEDDSVDAKVSHSIVVCVQEGMRLWRSGY